MKLPTRSEAQQRADEIRVFQRECERLRHEGVLELSVAQAAAVGEHHAGLLARYAVDAGLDAEALRAQYPDKTR